MKSCKNDFGMYAGNKRSDFLIYIIWPILRICVYAVFYKLVSQFNTAALDSSLMVHFRKRFPHEVINEINEIIT